VNIVNFQYRPGDLSLSGEARNPPTVSAGETVFFRNWDSAAQIYHSITACKNPCTASTGISYPLADGPVDFDSGQLGYGPSGLTAAANRDSWETPSDLAPGTYTYFCRVHPFMRGALRVKP
jgi:plastocyanin